MIIELTLAILLLIVIYAVIRKISYSKRVQHIAETQEKNFQQRFENDELER